MKKVSVLGATGSVGLNTLKLLKDYNNSFNVIALTAYNSYKTLAKYAKILKVDYVVIGNAKHLNSLQKLLRKTNTKCLAGEDNIIKVAGLKTDILVSSIVGAAGLKPTMKALKNTKVLALANKESLVSAGKILLKEAKKYKTKIIPLDSEHSAIFQIIDKSCMSDIKEIILTASGGPFWRKKKEYFAKIKVKQALKHPNWKMGSKITIDSATLMNKFLERVEASILFKLDLTKIKILIHPDSLIHGIVNFIDGTSVLIANKPDMQISINYALHWPKRKKTNFSNLNLAKIKALNFYMPDENKFPSLRLAKYLQSSKFYDSKLIVINAANEIAVNSFLEKKISYLEIVKTITKTLVNFKHRVVKTLNDVILIDKEARKLATNLLNNRES